MNKHEIVTMEDEHFGVFNGDYAIMSIDDNLITLKEVFRDEIDECSQEVIIDFDDPTINLYHTGRKLINPPVEEEIAETA